MKKSIVLTALFAVLFFSADLYAERCPLCLREHSRYDRRQCRLENKAVTKGMMEILSSEDKLTTKLSNLFESRAKGKLGLVVLLLCAGVVILFHNVLCGILIIATAAVLFWMYYKDKKILNRKIEKRSNK